MTKAEKIIIEFLRKHTFILIILIATVIGMIIRRILFGYVSRDFSVHLSAWWDIIKSKDISVLSEQVGDYNIPYQIIIFIMTRFNIKSIYAYKLLSTAFDFVLSAAAAMLAAELYGKKKSMVTALTYSVVFCSITVFLNSACWAQCDSIYTSFIILSLCFMFKDKNVLSFVMLGIALGFKLQTVFILPAFIYYYVSSKRFSVFHFLIVPAVDIIMCLPAVIVGRPFKNIIGIYLHQVGEYPALQVNMSNFTTFLGQCLDPNSEETKQFMLEMGYFLLSALIYFTLMIFAVVMVIVIHKKSDLFKPEAFLMTAIWSCFTCVMFLPSMHERYSYVLDALLIIYAVVYRKRFWAVIVCNLVSLRGYTCFLFKTEILPFNYSAVIYFVTYLVFSYIYIKETVLGDKENGDEKRLLFSN